jgi:hypothetical protein
MHVCLQRLRRRARQLRLPLLALARLLQLPRVPRVSSRWIAASLGANCFFGLEALPVHSA